MHRFLISPFALFIFAAQAISAEEIQCANMPLPIAGTYTSPNSSPITVSFGDQSATNCPTSFMLRGVDSVGAPFQLEFSATFGQEGQDISFQTSPTRFSDLGVWPQLNPVFDENFEYYGGIRTFTQFNLLDHLTDGMNPADPLVALGEFTWQNGEAAECICNSVAEWIQNSIEWRELYSDENIIFTAMSYGLHLNMARRHNLPFYLERHGRSGIARVRPVEGSAWNLDFDIPDRFDGLTYQGLLEAIRFENLIVEDFHIRPHPNAANARRMMNFEGHEVGPDGLPLDRDNDGINDSASGFTRPGTCELVMPPPETPTQQCEPAVQLSSLHAHELTHVRQCQYANSIRAFIYGDNDFVQFREDWALDDENTSGLPSGFRNTIQSQGVSRYTMTWPRQLAANEVEAYTNGLDVLEEFAGTYCPDR